MHDLLKKLNSLNIAVGLVDNRLDIKAPKGAMTAELLEEIKRHKEPLLQFLSKYKVEATNVGAIPKVSIQEAYLLSSSQYRLWLLDQLEESNNAYVMPSTFRLKGKLNVTCLKAAFDLLIQRHEILRTNIGVDEKTGNPQQVIAPPDAIKFKLGYVDLSDELEKQTLLDRIRQKELSDSFGLSSDSLLRASLIKWSEDQHVLIIVMHHIISDAWSGTVFKKDLFTFYRSALIGQSAPLAPLPIQYKDYAAWQQSGEQQAARAVAKAYWLNLFAGQISVVNIPSYKTRPAIKTYSGARAEKIFSSSLIQAFDDLCKTQGATLFMGLLAVLKTLLYKYTRQSDIVVGCPIAGRENVDLQDQIGFYVNTLALRNTINATATFIELLQQIKESTLAAYSHQDYPFDELVKNLNLPQDRSRNPLFDIILNVTSRETISDQPTPFGELTVEEIPFVDATSKFDLEFLFKENKQKDYQLLLTYNTDIYEESFVSQMTEHLEEMMTQIVANPGQNIAAISYLTSEEKTQLLNGFNDTQVEYPVGKNFVEFFAAQVKKTPENTAIVYEGKILSYQELEERSNQLAHFLLQQYPIAIEDLIAVQLKRSDWLIVSFLAVLKTGAAYVPIDQDYPQERMAYIVSDSHCQLTINDALIENFTNTKSLPTTAPSISLKEHHLAYVIYTSGSSGLPKGVMIEHRNLLNLCHWHLDYYQVTEGSRGTLYAGIAFDASIWEMCPYLLAGAALYPIFDQSIRLDTRELHSFLTENKISHSYLPTAVCQELVNSGRALPKTKVLTGGDTLQLSQAPSFELYNNYGPTENTVVSTAFRFKETNETSIPIGKPIANTQLYILDETLALVPVGIPGKLYLSGAGIARAYLNQSDLTAERFIAHPFMAGERLYDTGDWGKYLPDGNVLFLGREDSQIKIRGYRIELGEIEQAILKFAPVKQVVVEIKLLANEKKLVAYLLGDAAIDWHALRHFIAKFLPDYMIPSHYVPLENVPLTENGKIDRNALPEVNATAIAEEEYLAPRDEIEREVIAIWQEILGIEGIGVRDNFFVLGGDSIQLIRSVNRINQMFHTSFSSTVLFEVPEVEGIAQLIRSSQMEKESEVVSTSGQNKNISFAQERLWLTNELEGSAHYHISAVLKVSGTLDKNILEKAFRKVVERHQVLRTVYLRKTKEITTEILESETWGISVEEDLVSDATQLETLIYQELISPFDLEKDYMLRVRLVPTSGSEWILLFIVHHIAADGWSVALIIKEVMTVYNAYKNNQSPLLPGLEWQYRDFANWQRKNAHSPTWQTKLDYWTKKLQAIDYLNLPKDREAIVSGQAVADAVPFVIETELRDKLVNLAKAHETTLFVILLTGFKVLLSKLSQQEDICVGVPLAGRNRLELESLVGCFLNVLALRSKCSDAVSFTDFLHQVETTVQEGYQHQDIPFEEIVKTINPDRKLGRSPIFPVLFNMVNVPEEKIENEDFTIQFLAPPWHTNHYEITLYLKNTTEGISCDCVYNKGLFEHFRIHLMTEQYIEILKNIVDHPMEKIGKLNFKTKKEIERQEEDWSNFLQD